MHLRLYSLTRSWLPITGIFWLLQLGFVSAATAQSLIHIMAKYGGYDMDGNGTKEIESLSYLPFEAPNTQEVPKDGRLVLVMVEPRLLQDIPNSPYSKQDLLNRLERWKGDLRAEGFYSRFISTKVYSGADHQDGRTVLAMRRFLQDVYAAYPKLEGVMLVGSFPETMIVRDWLWKRQRDTLIVNGEKYPNVTYIQKRPEPIAHRSDIILADLNGNWDALYHKNPQALPGLVAIPDQTLPSVWPASTSNRWTSKVYQHLVTEEFQDFFYVKDARLDIVSDNGKIIDFWAYPNQHPELTSADRSLKTPTAQPEIVVSRINTRHISTSVDPGSGLVDANGTPRSLTIKTAINFSSTYKADPALERTLLIEYFDRNHLHRIGGYAHLPMNMASVDGKDFFGIDQNNFMTDASATWSEKKVYGKASLEKYIQFLSYNAAVKGYRSHGNRKGMQLYKADNPDQLSSLTGVPYRWEVTKSDNQFHYFPSFKPGTDMADWSLHRTLWQNKKLTSVRPAFYFFFGCEANSPENAERVPYNDPTYGEINNAENILYFTNGLAAMTRAKTFYDNIDGFPPALKENIASNLGDGWKAHYRYVSSRSESDVSAVKRSYWWSVLGDWTLRLKYSNGAALLGLKKNVSDFEAKAVLADHTWIGSHTSAIGGMRMNLNAQNLLPAGDINNDTREDFLITDSWGIGVGYHDGKKWQSLLAKPNDTWFGNWRYNASNNSAKDRIEGHGDFDGNGTADILIRSSWGIGILTYNTNTKTFSSLIADPVGTVYSDIGISWNYQNTDVIEAIADFNGDKRDDILIRGSKGRAVLMVVNGKLSPLMVVNYGTSSAAGGKTWVHQATDKVVGVADFSAFGTAKSILLMHSTKGLGIMNASSSARDKFLVQSIQAPGTRFGGWLFNPNDNTIEATADFDKDGKDEIVITSAWGIGLLTTATSAGSPTFTSLVCKPRGTSFGTWPYSPGSNPAPDKIIGVGDFDADGAADILIQRPQHSLGVLKLNAAAATFTCLKAIHYNSTLTKPIDGWYPKAADVMVKIGNFDGATGQEILLYRTTGTSAKTTKHSAVEEEALASASPASGSFIFPNPAREFISVQRTGAEIAYVQIYNLIGNLMVNAPVTETINVSALPAGVYMVHFRDAQGADVKTEKLIKQ